MIYVSILLYVYIISSSTLALKIEKFTDGDVKKLFYTAPDHEVVSVIHSVKKRSTTQLSINVKINGTDRQFILQSVKGFFAGKDTKVWLAKIVGNKFEYTLQKDVMEKVNITFYHDEKTQSAISHTVNQDGISEFNGFLDFDKIIRPFEFNNRKRRDAYSEFTKSTNDKVKNYHIIHKRASIRNDKVLNNYPNMIKQDEKSAESKSTKPTTVYPEILVYVDTTLLNYFNNDIVKTLSYTLTLWNGVDLNFRDMKDPLVRLNIAGIVLCQDQIIPKEPFEITQETLIKFSKFMHDEEQFKLKEDYDIAVLLGSDPNFIYGVEGFAHLSGACASGEQLILSTMIVVDNYKFSGINTAAHELAHLFGAPEDGEKGDLKINSPGAENCTLDDGFIMGNMQHDRKQYIFSSCSKEVMSYYFSLERAKCLFNNPAVNRTDKQILRILPGKYMTIDEQCQKRGFLKAYFVNPDICANIQCITYDNIPGELPAAALEGTPCDSEKFCLRGECVEVKFDETDENSISPKILFPSYATVEQEHLRFIQWR